MVLVKVSKRHGLAVFQHDVLRGQKVRQFEEAMDYCRLMGVGARKGLRMARADDPDKWPIVKYHTLDARLRKKVVNGKENAMKWLLTNTERNDLAASMEAAGKAGYAFDKPQRDQAVVDILLHRAKRNKAGGRRFVKLSPAAERCLKNGRPGKYFWKCFFVQFQDLIHVTKESITSVARLKQCTRAVAEAHIKDLIALLIRKDIYDAENDCIFPGKEANIIWEDEMGQFFNYQLKKGKSANVVGAKGVRAGTGEAENRQQFPYDGAVGGDLFVYDLHLIFRAEHFTADMAPPCIAQQTFYMSSTTAKGCQIGSTFLERQKMLLKQARSRGVRGDIVFVTDGHASRYYVELLRWLDASATDDPFCNSGNDMFITPPNATGICCVLDQLFQSLHRVYGSATSGLKLENGLSMPVGRYEAIQAMVHVHQTWCTEKEKFRAFKVCGLRMDGLYGGRSTISVDHFPAKSFVVGDTITSVPVPTDAVAIMPPPCALAIMPPPGIPAVTNTFSDMAPPDAPRTAMRSPSLCAGGTAPDRAPDTAPSVPPNPTPSAAPTSDRATPSTAHPHPAQSPASWDHFTNIPTPSPSITRGTPVYYEEKIRLMAVQHDDMAVEMGRRAALQRKQMAMSPSPLEAGVVKTSWFKKKELPNGNFRIPAHQGSLAGSNLLEGKEAVEIKIANTVEIKESETKARREAYEKCRAGCVCNGDVCAAAGLYLCRFCNTYKKQKCGVQRCKELYTEQDCKDLPLPKKKKVVLKSATKKRKRDDPDDGPSAELSEDASSDELSDGSDHDDHECEDPYKIGDDVPHKC